MGSQHEDSAPAEESANTSNDLDEERHEALRRFGKLGAYTAPTLLAMLASEKAIAITGGCR
jgi:hypothetical protein